MFGPTFLISNGPAVKSTASANTSKSSSGLSNSSSTSSSVVDSNQGYQNAWNVLISSLKSLFGSFSSSAVQAANSAADKTNSFNAQQAALNRQFQQTSADKAMKFEAEQAKQAMQFEAEQAQKAMDFNERMSNTTYQRAIADLKAAGLSPLLAYGNMQTSSPQGVMASGHSASGVSASGSSASGVKADTSSAYKADRDLLSQYITLVTLGVTSALKEVDQTIDMVKAVGSIVPF